MVSYETAIAIRAAVEASMKALGQPGEVCVFWNGNMAATWIGELSATDISVTINVKDLPREVEE